MARKGMRLVDKSYQPPIPLDECKKIIKKVNSYERKKGVAQPFKNQDYAIHQLLFTIDLFNNTVDSLITNSTLTPKNQKDFYKKLNKRVSRLLEFLQEGPPEYLGRIYMHQRDKRIPEQSFNGNAEDLYTHIITREERINPQNLINTLQGYSETIGHLYKNPINKNRKNNHRDDLRHLIDLLFEMYIKCSGRTPGYTNNKYKVYKGDFVLLVELVIPYVKPPFDIKPTNEAIGEGIKLYTKHSL
jgi:hypothetical protein